MAVWCRKPDAAGRLALTLLHPVLASMIKPSLPFFWHIGITGGIGSGKSTVVGMLQNAGAFVIDADQLARDCTGPHGAAMPRIRAQFGKRFIGPDGAMLRAVMRDHVFQNLNAKRQLEAIIHPIVLQQAQELAANAVRSGTTVILHEIPLLTESGHWRKRLHRVIVVDCDASTQIQRVMQRSGLSQDAAAAVVAAQAERQQRLAIADAVIYNGWQVSQEQLLVQVSALAHGFGLMIAPKEPPSDSVRIPLQ